MEAQRGEQAEDGRWHALGDLGQRVLGSRDVRGRRIDPARPALDEPLAEEALEFGARDAAGSEVHRSYQAHLVDDSECAVLLLCPHGWPNDTKRRGLCTSPDEIDHRRPPLSRENLRGQRGCCRPGKYRHLPVLLRERLLACGPRHLTPVVAVTLQKAPDLSIRKVMVGKPAPLVRGPAVGVQGSRPLTVAIADREERAKPATVAPRIGQLVKPRCMLARNLFGVNPSPLRLRQDPFDHWLAVLPDLLRSRTDDWLGKGDAKSMRKSTNNATTTMVPTANGARPG